MPESEREAISNRLNRVAYHLEDGFNPVGLLYPYTAEQADIMRGLLDDLHAVSDWLDAQPAAPEVMTIPEDVRERLAAVQHEIWAHWMRYLFDVCETDDTRDGRVVIIPADKVKRWQRQMNTPYVDLTDREQESDRHQADKILAALDVSAAPDVMTMPDDVRAWINSRAAEIANTPDSLGVTDAERQTARRVQDWLDAQPEAPAPDWTTAPEWAQSHVYAPYGYGMWVENVTVLESIVGDRWETGFGRVTHSRLRLPVGVDWRTTLRRRPEPQS